MVLDVRAESLARLRWHLVDRDGEIVAQATLAAARARTGLDGDQVIRWAATRDRFTFAVPSRAWAQAPRARDPAFRRMGAAPNVG